MVSRVTLLLMIVIVRRATWVLEQPTGSLLRQHPRYVNFVRCLRGCDEPILTYSINVSLGCFGAPSQKPLTLSSNNRDFLNALYRPFERCRFFRQTRAALLVRKGMSKVSGKTQVTGIKRQLAESQYAPW
jgi:hypothetical protein